MVMFLSDVSKEGSSPCVLKKGDKSSPINRDLRFAPTIINFKFSIRLVTFSLVISFFFTVNTTAVLLAVHPQAF